LAARAAARSYTPVTGELTNDGARFAQLAISGNRVR
jgi:hypothetical protein